VNRIMLILVCAVIAVGLAAWLFGAMSAAQSADPWTIAGIIGLVFFVALALWRIVSARLKKHSEGGFDDPKR